MSDAKWLKGEKSRLNGHLCTQCVENESVLTKYKKLVELLYKKIKQLQKKSKIQISTENQSIDINNEGKKDLQLQSYIKDKSSIQLNSQKDKLAALTGYSQLQTIKQYLPDRIKQDKKVEDSDMDKLQKVSVLVNGLTEEVMQLKSNLMHIRYCIYALLKQLKVGQKINSNPIALNITLALISIYQFSENEKEEMFRAKKVKLRKRERDPTNKQNIFITIKEI